MTGRKEIAHENLVALRMAFAALVKAGEESLAAAYNVGQIIDALSRLYTQQVLADAVDRSTSTIGKYGRLFRMYPTFDSLLMTARERETYDISLLTMGPAAARAHYAFQCGNCGSWDTHRKLVENAA